MNMSLLSQHYSVFLKLGAVESTSLDLGKIASLRHQFDVPSCMKQYGYDVVLGC